MNNYKKINLKYPQVRKDEYGLLSKESITAAQQIPLPDPIIKIPQSYTNALSFINTHHHSNAYINKIFSKTNYQTIHIFEVPELSTQSFFLDSFVSKYRKKPHQGNYLSYQKLLEIKNKQISRYKLYKYQWHLPQSIAVEFLINIFNLDYPPNLQDLCCLNYNGTTLDWQLAYFQLTNKI